MHPGVIIVSNRLPVSVKKVDGKLEFYPSVGGLATGLASYADDKRNKWIGWPGIPSDKLNEKERQQITEELEQHNCFPVFLTQKQLDNFYNGFSNSVLWPAFHELPVDDDEPPEYWRSYQRVNAMFADAVLSLSSRGGTVWVHDYQLLLLPSLLREQRPTDKIGFFLHIPFPNKSVFAATPHAATLLAGLLGADLLGFHTKSYVQHFFDYCREADVGIVAPRKLVLPNRVVRVTDFPMGIDYGKFARATRQRAVKAELLKLNARYGSKKIILTVDRLDPTKGLVERVQAYRELLQATPKLRGKVVLVMLCVPSRTEVPAYKQLKLRLEKLVRQTNQEFGTLRWRPVEYMYKSVAFAPLSALYQRADVAFIAPIKDGMNLVAKEYMASNPDGVLVLSTTAGAAEELKDAILVNPHESGSLASGLAHALMLSPAELKSRAQNIQERISGFTVHDWAGTFMKTLQKPVPGTTVVHQLSPARQREIRRAYRAASERLILLDYDGVLVPFQGRPERASPGQQVHDVLADLVADGKNRIVIISGRPKQDLQRWFGDTPGLTLIAEHGIYVRKSGQKYWRTTTTKVDDEWMEDVRALLETYTLKTPGSQVETKRSSLVWHYRQANPYYAQKHLVTLKRLLARIAKQHPISIEQGNMILEVRARDIHKGNAAVKWLSPKTNFVLAIGDDYTDEDMFATLPIWSHTVKVGRGRTAARFRARNITAVLALLKLLAK